MCHPLSPGCCVALIVTLGADIIGFHSLRVAAGSVRFSLHTVVRYSLQMDERRLADLGSRIRAERAARGETQQEVAQAVGIHRTHLSRIEGGGENITLDTLWSLADHFGTSAARLLADDELANAIDELIETRAATSDPTVRTQVDANAQELISEAQDRGITWTREVLPESQSDDPS